MMSFLADLDQAVNRLLRLLLKLALAVFFAVLVVAILALGIGVALLSVLWSLLRGKRPAMFTVFHTFRQASQRFSRGSGAGNTRRADAPDIVDVQAREVRPGLHESSTPPRD